MPEPPWVKAEFRQPVVVQEQPKQLQVLPPPPRTAPTWLSGRNLAFGGSVATVLLLTMFRREIAPVSSWARARSLAALPLARPAARPLCAPAHPRPPAHPHAATNQPPPLRRRSWSGGWSCK